MNLDAISRDQGDISSDPATAPETATRLAIIDGDFHPAPRSMEDLRPFMSTDVWDLYATVGSRRRHGLTFEPYPKTVPRACRRDAWPSNGGPPGSDLGLIRD